MAETLNVENLKERIARFAEERNWEQYHSPKNLSMALTVEAAELQEIFQWMSEVESRSVNDEKTLEAIGDELADILVYAIRLAGQLGINIPEAIDRKMEKNAKKYPADKVRGSSKKYTEYE